jgi:hypothetical protein
VWSEVFKTVRLAMKSWSGVLARVGVYCSPDHGRRCGSLDWPTLVASHGETIGSERMWQCE